MYLVRSCMLWDSDTCQHVTSCTGLRECLTTHIDMREAAQMEDRVEDLLQAGVLDPLRSLAAAS